MKAFRVVGGFGLLLAGAAMLFIPGPGWLTIAAGLALLAGEFPWARRALDAIKATALRCRRWLTQGYAHDRENWKANQADGDESASRARSG